MKIKINNIGLIDTAEIRLDGLTIIAGENDSGKSTIGKALFSMIKAINNYKKDYIEDIVANISDLLDDFYFLLRSSRSRQDNNEYAERFHPLKFNFFLDDFSKTESLNSLNRFLDEYQQSLSEEIKNLNLNEKQSKELKGMFEKLNSIQENLYSDEESNRYVFKTISQILKSEFKLDLNNKFTKKRGSIEYIENGRAKFRVYTIDNLIKECRYSSYPAELDDVTYIESPFVFQMHKLITEYQFFNNTIMKGTQKNYHTAFPYHIKDLVTKLSISNYYDSYLEDNNTNIIDTISRIISGETSFNKENDEFVFQKKVNDKDFSFNTSNVASGIKSFSVIQTLLKAYAIKKRSLLIIDEPEVHLHPEWQVKYCEIIIALVESGVKVVVNSHSPYIIQALKYLSEQKELKDQTHFYISSKAESNKKTIVENVDDNLNSIFKKLSDPLQKLIWE